MLNVGQKKKKLDWKKLMCNIHASCLELDKRGILFVGDSGAGKSDMVLRLIEEKKAHLVADDRVDIKKYKEQIIASCPNNIKGLLEVRGIGIVKYPSKPKTVIQLVVRLSNLPTERIPEEDFFVFEGVKIPQVTINPKEISSTSKVLAAIRMLL